MKTNQTKLLLGFLLVSIIILPSRDVSGLGNTILADLDDFYEQDTFSVRVDQNSESETEKGLYFIEDLYNDKLFNESIDTDEFNDDIYSMAYDKTDEFYTMYLGLEKMINYVNLSEYSFPSFSFRNYLPYTKLMNYFTSPYFIISIVALCIYFLYLIVWTILWKGKFPMRIKKVKYK